MTRTRSARRAGLAVLALALATAGCYESAFPLDPLPRVALDPAIMGTWRCLTAEPDDSSEPLTIIIGSARERVYSVSVQEGHDVPDRYEAHGSMLGGRALFSIRDLGTSSGKPWAFVRYSLLRPVVLHVEIVNADALKGVVDSPDPVRRAIERQLGNPRLFLDLCTCVRAKGGKPL